MTTRPERWTIRHGGREHVVELADVGLRKELVWWVDGTEAARRRTSDERVVLDGGDHGAVGVRLPALFGPARRVALHEPGDDLGATTAAQTGVGGVDLDPEPGSAAARREEWIRAHPRQHAARRGVAAALGVLVPLFLLWLWQRVDVPWPDLSLPRIPLPDLPDIPWPELPGVPWPDLPSIPWPDWSLPDLPAWVKDVARFVGPVVLAVTLAVGEVRRRRRQDAEKERRRAEADGTRVEADGTDGTGGEAGDDLRE